MYECVFCSLFVAILYFHFPVGPEVLLPTPTRSRSPLAKNEPLLFSLGCPSAEVVLKLSEGRRKGYPTHCLLASSSPRKSAEEALIRALLPTMGRPRIELLVCAGVCMCLYFALASRIFATVSLSRVFLHV
eukprot:RCo021960